RQPQHARHGRGSGAPCMRGRRRAAGPAGRRPDAGRAGVRGAGRGMPGMTGARVLSAALLLLCLFAPAFAARGAGAGEPGQAHRRLAAELERLAATIDGEVGVAAWPLDDPGHAVTLNADRRFPMASTYKVAIAGAVLARAGRGELRLPDMV